MATISPQIAYTNLKLLDEVNAASSALYRELAQEVLADPKISLSWRQAIADRLNQANNLLTMRTVNGDDSY
jgi:hypothetical protein